MATKFFQSRIHLDVTTELVSNHVAPDTMRNLDHLSLFTILEMTIGVNSYQEKQNNKKWNTAFCIVDFGIFERCTDVTVCHDLQTVGG